jgi:mannose-6-phosphate isomerase class I
VSPVIFLDVPKNEIQYRMRAGSVTNLGNDKTTRASEMYKRFYFVDWVVVNAHKKAMVNTASIFADVQWSRSISWMTRETLHDALFKMSRSVFRVRPWFEAGAWGGQWMKERFAQLSKDEVNYAWSFELIVPENGIVFESDGRLLELSFDTLMYSQGEAVLGKHAAYFGDEFPIRFDFLDTWDGGNLSIQCHPTLSYMRKNFGEKLTQDETYYILDCKPGAVVYLGFQENIDPAAFRNELEKSRNENAVVDVDRYVQSHVAAKHDLFLIPNGTVHSAGANNLVLEISATPYIFTFKMYDWLRLDLNGEPRAINIGHAFNNLSFERKGDRVKEELIANPVILSGGADSQLVHLPTHAQHFYDVHRIEFDSDVLVHTNGSCHVLMVVEGDGVIVESTDGTKSRFSFAETFVVSAAANVYRLINTGSQRVKVVKAFIKDQIDFLL